MILHNIAAGIYGANCYIVGCEQTKEAVIIDPGGDGDRIKTAISRLGLKLKCIINTHGHADHIAANNDFDVPVLIHSLDSDFLKSPRKNMSLFFGFSVISKAAEHLLEDKDKINVGRIVLEIAHTPGHTPGSICVKAGQAVFSGDTLFAGSIGRADLEYSSEKDLFDSIKNKLLVLDEEVAVYPGHGKPTTIGEEKRKNPFLQ